MKASIVPYAIGFLAICCQQSLAQEVLIPVDVTELDKDEDDKGVDFEALDEQLNQALATWQSTDKSKGYIFSYTKPSQIQYWENYPWLVEVDENGEFITASDSKGDDRESTEVFTIDQVFDRISTALLPDPVDPNKRNAYDIKVEYDATYGFPKRLTIDYDERIADEEFHFDVHKLVVIPTDPSAYDRTPNADGFLCRVQKECFFLRGSGRRRSLFQFFENMI